MSLKKWNAQAADIEVIEITSTGVMAGGYLQIDPAPTLTSGRESLGFPRHLNAAHYRA
jgi:hypothetical protein